MALPVSCGTVYGVLYPVSDRFIYAGCVAEEQTAGRRVRKARRCGTRAALDRGEPGGSYLSDRGPKLLRRCREADLLLRPLGNTVYVMPPYCIDEADLARVWAEIAAAADDVAAS